MYDGKVEKGYVDGIGIEILGLEILNSVDKVETNTVTVMVENNYGMQATKPTWTLSADTKTYTKVYNANGT